MAKLELPVVAIKGERNTPIGKRDGTVLRADIFRTDSADSHPVLLIRNPYGEPMVRMAAVDVASSNFPCYDRNPGNGAPAGTATPADFVIAEQTVFHDAGRPSYITLAVIPR